MVDVNKLAAELKAASTAYYGGAPVMTDAEFDMKEEELRMLDPTNEFFSEVGGELIPDKEKVNLGQKMFSTDKAFSLEELTSFWNRTLGAKTYVVSNKIDGMAVNLNYEDGQLVLASTRGNGTIGRVFTQKALKLVEAEIPKRLPEPYTGKIRGEVFLTNENFDKLNFILAEEGSEQQDNCRNSAAGLINSGLSEMKNADKKLKLLAFRAYGAYDDDAEEADNFGSYPLYTDQLEKAQALGFQTVEWWTFTSKEAVEKFLETAKSWLGKFDFPNDGVVIRVNEQDFARRKGEAKKYLNAVTAFKFQPEIALVKVLDIIWQQGSVEYSPVVIIEPTEIAGATVTRASGHSVKNLIDVEAYPGNMVALVRSGEVIPKISHRRLYDEMVG